MRPENTGWFEMPSPFQTEMGRVLMLEPPWSDADALREQLLDATYGKPFVIDDGELRYLYFSISLMQSAMRLKTPNTLELRYTQKMMGFLLFNPRPKRIVLIGLGGGSLIKFCYHRLPATHITAIEIDPHVLALREAFLLPPDDERLQTLQADGAEHLEQTEKGIDVLLLDAFDKTGFAPGLANRDFLESAHAKLSGSGILVINLAGGRDSYEGLIDLVLEVFDHQALLLPVPKDGNNVLFAFKERNFEPRWRWLHNYAKELKAKFGLDFPMFVQKLERSAKVGLTYREAAR
ncbi:MAG: spermidine synthase-like protein [Betaproteobacteria bacterium]